MERSHLTTTAVPKDETVRAWTWSLRRGMDASPLRRRLTWVLSQHRETDIARYAGPGRVCIQSPNGSIRGYVNTRTGAFDPAIASEETLP